MPGLYFQQLSHSWGTQHLLHPKVCQQQTTSQCVCVFIFVNECVHVFVCLCMGPRGTEMLVYPSAFVVMFLRTFMTFVNTLLKCHSPGCAYSLRDAYNIHHTSHYSQLESVHDSNWKNRLFKWKSRELTEKKHFDFRPPELHLGTFVAWKVWKASKPEEINRFYKYHWH